MVFMLIGIGPSYFQIKSSKKKIHVSVFFFMGQENVSKFVENILIILSNLPPGLRLPLLKKD